LSVFSRVVKSVVEESSKVLVDRQRYVELITFSVILEGHVLIEGVPGIAKTLTAKTIAKLLNLTFSRIQCTVDTLPSDIIGTKIFNQKTSDFELRLGPIYSNIVLVDEINRASPRAQSALLEAMQERQVTIDGETVKLPKPFTVLAKQNPIELEGTFPLPEAQLDRFYIKVAMGGFGKRVPYHVDDAIYDYIAKIVEYSNRHQAVRLGVTPRGALMLLNLAKEFALYDHRKYVIPDDVKKASLPALSHRVLLKPEYIAEGYTAERVIQEGLV
jgi:MoxR-like ATPase